MSDVMIMRRCEHQVMVLFNARYLSPGRRSQRVKSDPFALPGRYCQHLANFCVYNNAMGVKPEVWLHNMAQLPADMLFELQLMKNGELFGAVLHCTWWQAWMDGNPCVVVGQLPYIDGHDAREQDLSVTVKFTATIREPVQLEYHPVQIDDGVRSYIDDLLANNRHGDAQQFVNDAVSAMSPTFLALLDWTAMVPGASKHCIERVVGVATEVFGLYLCKQQIPFGNSVQRAVDLLYCAEKYDLPKLTQVAQNFIDSKVAINNMLHGVAEPRKERSMIKRMAAMAADMLSNDDAFIVA